MGKVRRVDGEGPGTPDLEGNLGTGERGIEADRYGRRVVEKILGDKLQSLLFVQVIPGGKVVPDLHWHGWLWHYLCETGHGP